MYEFLCPEQLFYLTKGMKFSGRQGTVAYHVWSPKYNSHHWREKKKRKFKNYFISVVIIIFPRSFKKLFLCMCLCTMYVCVQVWEYTCDMTCRSQKTALGVSLHLLPFWAWVSCVLLWLLFQTSCPRSFQGILLTLSPITQGVVVWRRMAPIGSPMCEYLLPSW